MNIQENRRQTLGEITFTLVADLMTLYIYNPFVVLDWHDAEDAVRPPGALLAGVRRRHRPHLNISL